MKQPVHPWESARRSGRWKDESPPLPAVVEFCSYLKDNGLRRILDLGAGGGRHALLMAEKGFQVVALDVSDTAQGALDRKVRRSGLGVTLVRHEMGSLPFIDGYFDGIVCTNVLHHGRRVEVKVAFAEAMRVLRKGGAALFVVVSDKDFRFGTGRRLERGTYVFTSGEEKGIVHHFFAVGEFRALLKDLELVKLWEEFLPGVGGNWAHIYAVVRKP
ncbi:MAG: class I SAM-dependent methyltransferase [Nitrososphaerota archaeon]|nr:class I SAM-dependent methyltransferase [Nitrososphaerota archaeon]MDG7024061.1 class I SAM-dependent methyltransferase [Nitrososphaerota archaeon]